MRHIPSEDSTDSFKDVRSAIRVSDSWAAAVSICRSLVEMWTRRRVGGRLHPLFAAVRGYMLPDKLVQLEIVVPCGVKSVREWRRPLARDAISTSCSETCVCETRRIDVPGLDAVSTMQTNARVDIPPIYHFHLRTKRIEYSMTAQTSDSLSWQRGTQTRGSLPFFQDRDTQV